MAAATDRAPTPITKRQKRSSLPLGTRLMRAGLAAVLVALAPRLRAEARIPHREAEHTKGEVREITSILYHRISDDRVLAISAGVTFYALLAIFPAIAALVSVYGLYADAHTIHSTLASASSFLPGGAIQVIGSQIKHITSSSSGALGLMAFGGIAISIWSANSGVKAMFDALNIVHHEREKRSFVRLNEVSLAFTLGSLVLALIALTAVVIVPAFLKTLGWSGLREIIAIGRWPAIWALVALGIALIYRFGPSRNDIPWRWLSWGSALASLVWLGASMAFSWYAADFGTYNKTYGSLGAVIGFMTWIWISAIIVLLGEELNETIETLRHPQHEKPHPLGAAKTPA